MSTFFAGNDKQILLKKQVDKDTPVTVWTDAMPLRVYEWSADPARVIAPLNETDASFQRGASHVSAIGPALSFGIYGRPSELDLICEGLLGPDDPSATVAPTTHLLIPDQQTDYFSILVVDPFENTRYEGCRLSGGVFTAQDTGETELRVTGLQWLASTMTHGITTPSPMPVPVDELPFIYAECTVKYDGVSVGRTSQFTITVTRNTTRVQGDNGFEALDIVHGKFQADVSVTRYVADSATMRAVDTGTEAGTVPTAVIFTEPFSVLFNRGAGATSRQLLIASAEIAYETREQALDLDGKPIAEVLGGGTQPQADIEDNLSIIVVNGKATTES